MNAEPCACSTWVSGGIRINFERDAADGHLLAVRLAGPLPERTAVSRRFVQRLNDPEHGAPGAAEWTGGPDGRDRLILRLEGREFAYRRVGECSCGYIMVERDRPRTRLPEVE